MQEERRAPKTRGAGWRNTVPQAHGDGTSEPCQNTGHSFNRLIHVLKRRRKTKAEAHPLAAMVGMNIGSGERCFDGSGMRCVERKKVAVGGAIAERCDKVGGGQTLQAEWLEAVQEVRHQRGRMRMYLIYAEAVRGHPREHRTLPIDANGIESCPQEARTADRITYGPVWRSGKRAKFSEPTRVARPGTIARRTVQEASALPRHSIFVPTSDVLPKRSAASKDLARSLHATTRCSGQCSSHLSHTVPTCQSIR